MNDELAEYNLLIERQAWQINELERKLDTINAIIEHWQSIGWRSALTIIKRELEK